MFLNWLFKKVYGKWLLQGDRVIKVKNWRCAIVENKYGERGTMSPCFWWFN